ncbi:MAG: hypothetical protein RBU30_23110, partial [Polyangia bacterium]|nr:hypothetical protein [Polyangia bacterium]
GRPLGAWLETPPSAGLPEVVREEPWPMEGRCPGRSFYPPVLGPREPTVAWSLPGVALRPLQSAVVDSSERIFLLGRAEDPDASGVLSAVDSSGALLWSLDLGSPVVGSPAIGGGGEILLSLPYSILALKTDGSYSSEAPYGAPPPFPANYLASDSPVLSFTGGVLVSTFRTLATMDSDLELSWERELDRRNITGPVVDASGRASLLMDYGWDLGYPALSLQRFDRLGLFEELAILQGDRMGSLALDASGAFYIVTLPIVRPNDMKVRAYGMSPVGELRIIFEDEYSDLSIPAQALGPGGPVLCLTWNDPSWQGRVVQVGQNGARLFDTLLEGARTHGPMIVDGEGWIYVGGRVLDEHAAVFALDPSGALRWSILLPGSWRDPNARAFLLAMGGQGRIYAAADGDLFAIGEASVAP